MVEGVQQGPVLVGTLFSVHACGHLLGIVVSSWKEVLPGFP